MYHSEDPIPSSPFVNISSTGQSVTMATFLKQNPPNGVPMSARATGQRKGKRAMADADSQTGSESPKQERSLAQRGEFVQRDTNTVIAPQVTIVDGKIIVDESSLTVAREPAPGIESNRERVEETSRRITSASFMKSTPRDRWTTHETRIFYEGLSVFGTDFGMMMAFLPKKKREQIKNKYKKEDRENPQKIQLYLNQRKSLESIQALAASQL